MATKQTAIIAAIRRGHRPARKGEAIARFDDKPRLPDPGFIPHSVDKVERTAEDFAVRAGFDEDTVPNIAMAVREAAVNAILHGNAYDSAKQITASFETTADALIVRIADQGPGLDPDDPPRPACAGKHPARLRPRHLPHPRLHG